MNSRIAVVMAGVLLLGASGFLAVQALRLGPRMEAASAARRFEDVRASGNLQEIAKAAAEFVRLRPRDVSVRLLRARALLAAGKYAEARRAYAEAAGLAREPTLRAAAEIGRGSAILLKSSLPASADLDAAKKAFQQALRAPPRVPDAQACLAVVHAWAGDLKATDAAVRAAKGTLHLEPAIALACCRAFVAASKGDSASAHKEFRRAQALDPTMRTALGKYLARRVKVFELDAGSRPDASKELRKGLVEQLKAEGEQGIINPDTYPLFLRAAFACAGVPGQGGTGMGLLGRAIASRPEDPIPLLFRAVAVARQLGPLWEKAGTFATARGRRKSQTNPHLKEMDRADARMLKDMAKAAEFHAARGGEGAQHALGIFDFLLRWHLRKAELSTNPAFRRTRELAAASVALAADRCLGKSKPNKALAALMRSAGVLLAKHSAWSKAYACFARSLEILPGQTELAAFVEKMRKGMVVVAVHPPAAGRARTSRPLAGVEFSVPGWLTDLSAYKVAASVGTKDGPRTAITPVVSGTGLWYIPREGEFPEGLIEVRFEVTDPLSGKVNATASFSIDGSPPEITSRHPEPAAIIRDRQPLIRIGWKDPSGLDPGSVEVVLEPVAAQATRKVLVSKGRHKAGRYQGSVTWKAKSPVVPAEARDSGEIVTSSSGALPQGTFRVRARLRDAFGHLKEDAWTFTIR